jgi:hypothetical protein
MPFWQLDSAFLHEELKDLISLGHIQIISALSLLDPPLIHCYWLFAPTLFQLQLFPLHHQIPLLDQLSRGIDYRCQHITVFGEPGVLLETISMVAHQRRHVRQLAKIIELHAE